MSICVCECESEGSYVPINIKYRYPCQWITSTDPVFSSQGREVSREESWEVKEGRDKAKRRKEAYKRWNGERVEGSKGREVTKGEHGECGVESEGKKGPIGKEEFK